MINPNTPIPRVTYDTELYNRKEYASGFSIDEREFLMNPAARSHYGEAYRQMVSVSVSNIFEAAVLNGEKHTVDQRFTYFEPKESEDYLLVWFRRILGDKWFNKLPQKLQKGLTPTWQEVNHTHTFEYWDRVQLKVLDARVPLERRDLVLQKFNDIGILDTTYHRDVKPFVGDSYDWWREYSDS